jgi:hypothetical protein
MYKRLIIPWFIILLSFSFTASAQKEINSPYARFNIGAPEPQGPFRSRGMGGIGTGMRDNNTIHYMNPASYSSLDTNSFAFDFGFDFGSNLLTEGDLKYTSNDVNFNHLFMAFPIARGWGIATGIIPVSHGFYNISEEMKLGDSGYDPLTGPYKTYYKGEGGFSNFFLGTGVNITRNFSAGINMTVMFGVIDRNYSLQFDDLENYYHNSATEKLKLRGINFDYGLQYRAQIKDDYFLIAGFSMTSGKNYKSDYNYLAIRTSAYNAVDTVAFTSENSAPVFLPGTYRSGISFGKKNKFTTGFDYVASAWSKSKIPGYSGYAADTRRYMWGIEYIPEKFSNFSLLKRIEYRFGAHMGDNYLVINGEQVREMGVSFGVGIPMRRSLSRTNLFIDYTKKSGPEAAGLHTERLFTIGGSLNIYDFWFIQRKYK